MKKFRILVIILSLMCIAVLAVLIVSHFMPDDSDTIILPKKESYAVIMESSYQGVNGSFYITVHTDKGHNYYFSIDKTKIYGADGKRADADMLEEGTRIRFIYENAMRLGVLYDENGNPGPNYLYNCYEIHIIDE